MRRHIIDPKFFDDAIDMYAFKYVAYIVRDVKRDQYGMQKSTFDKVIVKGSLQSQGARSNKSKTGNTVSHEYRFYHSSKYRLNIGDFIIYDDKLLLINDSQPYKEYGVMECTLEMAQLNEHRDLAEFIHLQTGDVRI